MEIEKLDRIVVTLALIFLAAYRVGKFSAVFGFDPIPFLSRMPIIHSPSDLLGSTDHITYHILQIIYHSHWQSWPMPKLHSWAPASILPRGLHTSSLGRQGGLLNQSMWFEAKEWNKEAFQAFWIITVQLLLDCKYFKNCIFNMTWNLFFKSCEYCVQNILLSVERTTGLEQTDLYYILWSDSEQPQTVYAKSKGMVWNGLYHRSTGLCL